MPYFSAKPSIWPCPNIGRPGIVDHQRADAEVLVALAELIDRGALVGVVHEVDVALQDLRIELERVLHDLAILGVLLVAQHVHEGAVVDAVHPQRPDEVAFHQPERLGQQQRVRAPRRPRGRRPRARTRLGIAASNCSLRHAVLGARRDGAARARLGNQSRWKWRLASVIAASKRITGNCRATCRIVWMTASRTSGFR